MNHNMAKEWLLSASADLETINEIINNENLTHVMAFHSQQCVEKSLKAVLEFYELPTPKTHSILKLSKLASKYYDVNNNEMSDELDKLYIDTRYPGDFGLLPDGKPSIKRAKIFYNFAKIIFEEITIIVTQR